MVFLFRNVLHTFAEYIWISMELKTCKCLLQNDPWEFELTGLLFFSKFFDVWEEKQNKHSTILTNKKSVAVWIHFIFSVIHITYFDLNCADYLFSVYFLNIKWDGLFFFNLKNQSQIICW